MRDSVGLEAERHLTGGVHVTTRRDKFGRETFKGVGARNVEQLRRRYTWDMGNRLLVARDEITGRVARYDYDEFDNLISAEYERGGEVERLYRVPDRMGNLFESRERDDRRYDAGGRLAEDREHFYHYDCEGNLVFKEFKELSWGGNVIAPINKERLEAELGIIFRAYGTGWRYDWQSDGMLARVVRPDGKEVAFAYDALGRRIRKTYAGTTTHFVWDGNVPLHEWTEENEVVTWLFEQDTFVPAAKLVANGDCFSIVSDYLGTPMQAYDKNGEKVWEQELDIYGRQRKRPSAFIPFKYQGQYEDAETGLYYNRFRYYDPNAGSYISQDPIGLAGDNPTLYAYVSDVNYWNDVLGLTAEVYKLVATKDGYYDVYEWGNDKPVGKTYLKEGDTWKIGETTNFRTKKDGTEIQNRYTKKWLRQNNLGYKRLQYSPNKSAKTSFQNFETSRIEKFEKQFGKKPAGNKCYH